MKIDYAYAADITKSERDENGDLIVTGSATNPALDLDGDRCDPAWLKKAMPQWFEWGNIREMHQPILAGVGLEMDEQGDDWKVRSKCIDDACAKKIEEGGYKGYSIGIKNGVREVRDGQPWIVDGEIVEISYVDRPCNPTAKIAIAKMVGSVEEGDENQWQPGEAEEPTDVAKAAEPPKATEAVSPTDAPKADDGLGEKLDAILKALGIKETPKAAEPEVSKTPEIPTEAIEKIVKAAVAEVTKASEERIRALEAELTKVKAQPVPGGPVLLPPQQAAARPEDNASRAKKLRDYAKSLAPDVARDYNALADQLEAGSA